MIEAQSAQVSAIRRNSAQSAQFSAIGAIQCILSGILKTRRHSALYSALPGATRRYSALLGATRRYPALLGATRRYSALLGATRRYPALLGATRRYPALPGAARRYPALLGATRRYPALPGATRRYPALLGATRCYSALPGATRRSHYAVALSRRSENFKIGKVVSEDYAKKLARTHGRRVLSSRWVNTIKKPGLYRARLVVRDFASFGGSTLQEGIYSPTTTLEGLRLLLALVSVSGTLISGDVSVAFMHADCARVEVIQMPSNVSLAKKGGVVFVELRKAVNGLRSAPLSWYREISQFLESKGFTQVIDPTIYRRFTRGAKGETFLSIVLFYVDDILIWSQIPGEAEAIFGMLAKKYKLKQTGIIAEHKAGEVSFLGRKVFRTKEFEGTNVIFFGFSPEYLESCCEEFKITKGTDKLPSLERLVRDFEKKGTPEKLSPEAHDRYRRVLGKLAWASLTRPDLAFVTGFLGRFQAGPTESSEHAMRATLRWLLNLKPRVQRFPSERFTLKNECDPREITLFVDASWSLDSTSGGIISWMNCCLKAFSRKQPTTALSSAEAELMALTEGTKESVYMKHIAER